MDYRDVPHLLFSYSNKMDQEDIKNLFDEVVDKGFRDLIAFSSQLLSLLEQGYKVEITIKGFCSPLNYNFVPLLKKR